MGTTVLVHEATRDALAKTREAYGTSSIDAAIQRALRDATPSATDLWRRHRRKVETVCTKYGVTRLIAFGSRCRDDRHPGSDLDLLVTFPVESGLSGFFRLRDEMSAAFGVNVDMGEWGPAGDRVKLHADREGVAFIGSFD